MKNFIFGDKKVPRKLLFGSFKKSLTRVVTPFSHGLIFLDFFLDLSFSFDSQQNSGISLIFEKIKWWGRSVVDPQNSGGGCSNSAIYIAKKNTGS